MAHPWKTLDTVDTDAGPLELRRRGDRDFLITVDGRVLMNSSAQRSEQELGRLACRPLKHHPRPRVLIGGLGMGYTLRAVLDQLSPTARVVVAELNPAVVNWCRGPLSVLTDAAVADPRVRLEITDVANLIRTAAGKKGKRYDAVILDLYTGPYAHTHTPQDPLYGRKAVETAKAALNPGGIFAVWGENHDPEFENRLGSAGFTTTVHRPGRGGFRHVVYLGEKPIMEKSAATASASKQASEPKDGEFAFLRVKSVKPFGAFMDRGKEDDLLVPGSEQESRMKVGERHVVRILRNKDTGRPYGTTRIARHCDPNPQDLSPGDKVRLLMFRRTQLGMMAVVNEAYIGLIFRSEIFEPLAVGDRRQGYVQRIRDDGKIDLTLKKPGYRSVSASADKILAALKSSGGFIPCHDKSSPAKIERLFSMSKKEFKRTIGGLYKQRRIDISDQGIRLKETGSG
ncbi:MAG: hypothetical protein ACOC3W_03895 [Thermodesulfobacteriota bacterium]